MSNILFCQGYTTKYVIMNGIKSLFTLTIAWKFARSPRSGILGSNLVSDWYAAIIVVTGNYNKTENEILLFRTL
jgi:hypothetical protein